MPLKILNNKKSPKATIAILSGKGGVGKSTLTALLAHGLHKKKQKVGIVDADLYGPSIRYLFPEDSLPYKNSETIYPAISQGIKILSLDFFQSSAIIRAPQAHAIIKNFMAADFGELDWLLIDFPPGTGDIALTLLQQGTLNGAILVTTPQKLSLIDVKKAVGMLRKMKVPVLGLVENMSYFKLSKKEEPATIYPFGPCLAKDFSVEQKVPFLGQIPILTEISTLSNERCLNAFEDPSVEVFIKKIQEAVLSQNAKKMFATIEKEDAATLKMEEQGLRYLLRAPHVQKQCPCAQCTKTCPKVEEDVSFVNWERVGSYAFRFEFSSGCSFGIYDFDLLKGIAEC